MKALLSHIKRPWFVPTIAVLALCVSFAGYQHLAGGTPIVSAQGALARALAGASALAPAKVVHATYLLTIRGQSTGTMEAWARYDDSGAIAVTSLTFAAPDGHLQSRSVLTGDTVTTYDAGTNTIMSAVQDASALPNPLNVAALAALVRGGTPDSSYTARLLPATAVDGVAVTALQLDRTYPGPAVAGRPYRSRYLIDLDAQTDAVRLLQGTTMDGAGAVLNTFEMRLARYETVALAAAPTSAFALNAPASAHVATAPDGSTHFGTEEWSVANAVALADRPALLLSAPVAGLKLDEVAYTRTPSDTILSYVYGNGHAAFGVNLITTRGAVQMDDPFMARPSTPAQALNTTVAGQQVAASYYEPASESRVLLYLDGPVGVRIVSTGLSTDEFRGAVRALVDAHSDPEVVRQLAK